MGTLEKAGICVVAGLIAIIGVVGYLNRGGQETASRASQQASGGAGRLPVRRGPDLKRRLKTPASQEMPKREPIIVTQEASPGVKQQDPPGIFSSPAEGEKVDPVSVPVVPPPVPVKATPTEYVIKGGDCLSTISAKIYGTARMVAAIQKANPNLRASSLQIGQTITLPAPPPTAKVDANGGALSSEPAVGSSVKVSRRRPSFITNNYLKRGVRLVSSTPGAAAGTYIVKSGDTASEIAGRELGSVRFLQALRDANKRKNLDRLQVGWVLTLPSVN